MHLDDALAQRLSTQRLVGAPHADPAEAVRSLLAVQAQDAPLARWSIALRTGRPSDEVIRAAVDDGRLIRTHVLRPTWHYVVTDDLRWLLDLTAPKVLRAMGSRNKHLELTDPAVVRREVDALVALIDRLGPLTRRELVTAVGRDDLVGERLGQVIGIAELEGLLCSGPLAAGQHTYALVDDRVPPARPRDREEAIRELVLRFLSGHGPASVAQLTRWCTLTKREALDAVVDLGDARNQVEVNDEPHWHAPDATAEHAAAKAALLLPVFDEAYLTYPGSNVPRTPDHPWGSTHASFAEAGGGVVVHGRRDVGWWKRKDAARTTTVTMGLSASLSAAAREQIEQEAQALAAFTGRTLVLVEASG